MVIQFAEGKAERDLQEEEREPTLRDGEREWMGTKDNIYI